MPAPQNIAALTFPRGSEWRKWDLQVHTPSSLVHNYTGADPWELFLKDLEALPADFKVLGINDYIFLDGYRRLLTEKANGRLGNIETLFPVIELRLDKFGGTTGALSRVNFHVIFSNELDPDIIEQHFLNALPRQYQISPQHAAVKNKWAALPTKTAIEDLGRRIIESVPEKERAKFGSALSEGFNNLCLSLEAISEALRSHYFEGRFLTAVGKTEWADIKWTDQSIAEKKNIINSADLIFVASSSIDSWAKTKNALTEAGVNNRLLDCSDAHVYSTNPHKDRIGNCFTWIKADPTFAGLQQILNEPDGRIYIGQLPPKLDRVRSDKTRYIQSVSIKKKPGAVLRELWFDNDIQFNPGLVAIIGNKGKGKSALADTIGLLGNTRQHRAFSFLSANNFRNPRDNKARYFEATLCWESGTANTSSLDKLVDETQPELVKYIPQNFLEVICNEVAGGSETNFDKELQKVIFSHVSDTERLGRPSLDALLTFKTEETESRIKGLRVELHNINEKVVDLEARNTAAHRRAAENRLDLMRKEIEAHDATKPDPVEAPSDVTAQTMQELSARISELIKERDALDVQISNAKAQQSEYALQTASIDKALAKIAGLQQYIVTFLQEIRVDGQVAGIDTAGLVELKVDDSRLHRRRDEIARARAVVDSALNAADKDSAVSKRKEIAASISSLQDQLDEPHKRYQAYLRSVEEWEKRRTGLVGNDTTLGTLKFLEKQLSELADIPNRLSSAYDDRLAKSKAIHAEITRLAESYRTLYAPVQRFIDGNPIAKQRFQLNFEVAIVTSGFEDTFSSYINHGVAGTFCGVDEGARTVRDIIRRHDLDTEGGAIGFLTEIVQSLQHDKRIEAQPPMTVGAQLRKGQSIVALYDYIFSFEYLRPRYRLRMGEKELNQLSPGERGTLLLVFYLLIDKEQIPLIIDQPEENLDNQTVFELLVPCIKETKERRQVIIVTHNPNLAVVCDAEQIICASLDKAANYRMRYLSGAIENPSINKAIVDILEGTRPAFVNRDSKYEVSA